MIDGCNHQTWSHPYYQFLQILGTSNTLAKSVINCADTTEYGKQTPEKRTEKNMQKSGFSIGQKIYSYCN